MKDILGQTASKMKQSVAHLQEGLRTLRTGRANPGMVNQVMVEAYGTSMRLPDIATISVPESRQIVIHPFDGSTLHAIVKGIDAANLNLRAVVDGQVVRIKVPEMDSKMRQEMAKQAKKMGEDAKITIRGIRREANDLVKREKNEGNMPEDQANSSEKKIQKLTDDSCQEIDTLCAQKEKEILTI